MVFRTLWHFTREAFITAPPVMKVPIHHIARFGRFLAGQAVPFAMLPVFMAILVAGTIAQRDMDLFTVQKVYFGQFLIWAGPLPLPGGLLVCLILLVSLCVKFAFYSDWARWRTGINLAHLGVIVLLAGGIAGGVVQEEGMLPVTEGMESAKMGTRGGMATLPFTVRLERFEATYYPGTTKAKSYSSDVTILDGPLAWPATIEMNAPLRYKGYAIYQSAFEQPEGAPPVSIFTVVKNRAWLFPYLGTALMAAGLLLHFVLSLGRKRGSA